jgi:hypothetical protein
VELTILVTANAPRVNDVALFPPDEAIRHNELEDGSQRPTVRSAVGVHPDNDLENDPEVATPAIPAEPGSLNSP